LWRLGEREKKTIETKAFPLSISLLEKYCTLSLIYKISEEKSPLVPDGHTPLSCECMDPYDTGHGSAYKHTPPYPKHVNIALLFSAHFGQF